MASQGPLAPTAAASLGLSSHDWLNPTNVFSNDGSVADTTVPAVAVSDDLYVSGFGFSIPTTSTIVGMELTVEWTMSGSGAPEIDIFLTKDGSGKVGFQFLTGIGATSTVGGPTDMWGLTLVPSDINAAAFGAMLEIVGDTATAVGTIDFVTLTTYYTALPTGTILVPDFSTFPKPPLVR